MDDLIYWLNWKTSTPPPRSGEFGGSIPLGGGAAQCMEETKAEAADQMIE